jgi:CubicO group peptidase (beta-lactamase class C family)
VSAPVPKDTTAANAQPAVQPKMKPDAQSRYQLAAEYSKAHNGLSVLVMQGDKVAFEQYHNGHSADKGHRLASGTKSFWGIMAAAAVEDGLLSLDERVSNTITEWREHPAKSRVTVRQLLNISSGLVAGKRVLDVAPDKYNRALQMPLWSQPGALFQYGPANYYVFGELMRRKLAPRNETPLQYLERRVFKPIGLKYDFWQHDAAGNAHLPNGASLTAREWAKFGIFVKNGGAWKGKQLIPRQLVAQCVASSKANPAYGLTFWLNVPAPAGVAGSRVADGEASAVSESGARAPVHVGRPVGARSLAQSSESRERHVMRGGSIYSAAPRDLVMAAGAGQQRLYIIPSLDLVIVRQGENSRFRDSEFLARLLHGRTL